MASVSTKSDCQAPVSPGKETPVLSLCSVSRNKGPVGVPGCRGNQPVPAPSRSRALPALKALVCVCRGGGSSSGVAERGASRPRGCEHAAPSLNPTRLPSPGHCSQVGGHPPPWPRAELAGPDALALTRLPRSSASHSRVSLKFGRRWRSFAALLFLRE